MKFRLSSWITALALAVAGISFTAVPATAASGYCTSPGANVVVDFGALGGGVQKGCGRAGTATPAFESAGFPITYAQTGGMNGFVCTVSAKPGPNQGGCTGANGDGYWALFIANPGGSWTYASLGADSQPVNNGQTIAFAWQSPQDASGSGHRNPGTSPASVLKKPVPRPTATGSHTASAGAPASASPSATPSATTSPSAKHHKHARKTATATAMPTASATPSVADSQAVTAAHPAKSDNGLPWWVPASVVVLLIIGAGYAWWRKRAQG